MHRKGCVVSSRKLFDTIQHFSLKTKERSHGKSKRFAGLLALTSLNGMSKLFSSLESNPRSLEANLKFLLVAARAFIVPFTQFQRTKRTTQNFNIF